MWLKSLLEPLYRWLTAYMGACGFILYGGGKGGSSAPPPDPRLVEAQIKSLGIQDDMIEEIMAMSREMQPIQKEQMQFGLDSSRTAFDQSQADREYSLERRAVLSGLQDQMTADARSFSEQGRGEQLAGRAIADVQAQMDTTRAGTARQMARMGINPMSGNFAATNNNMDVATASAKAAAGNNAREAARMEGYSLTDRATNALAGYPAMGLQTTGNAAQFAATGLNLANQGAAGMMAGRQAAGSMAGQMGSNASSMWGQQANYHANMQEQDQTGSILGGLGGFAAGIAKTGLLSDRRLKEEIIPVGQDERTGLNLYEFAYIDDPEKRRFVGVMADEVEERFPDAVSVDPSGYKAVNYALLGIELKEVA
jgi:hypothetical protein